MATNKKENTAPETVENETPETVVENTDPNRPVEIFIERGYANDEPNLFVSVNGKNYLLPKGDTSIVPAYVADEINRSRRAQRKMDLRVKELLEKKRFDNFLETENWQRSIKERAKLFIDNGEYKTFFIVRSFV